MIMGVNSNVANYFVGMRNDAYSQLSSTSSGSSNVSNTTTTTDDSSVTKDTFSSIVKGDVDEYADMPYHYLIKDGEINYKGVTFGIDTETKSLTLGDMSDSSRILSIPLQNGGYLKVNPDNLGSLTKAISMFTAKDQGAILKAMSTYSYESSFVKKAEDDAEDTVENLASKDNTEDTASTDALDAMNMLKSYSSDIYNKLITGDTEPKIQIGSMNVTEKELDQMFEKFDKAEDVLQEQAEQDAQDLQEYREKQKELKAEN